MADFMLENYMFFLICHKSKKKKISKDTRRLYGAYFICSVFALEEKFGLGARVSVSSIPGFAYQI